jgi:hypothetical protein
MHVLGILLAIWVLSIPVLGAVGLLLWCKRLRSELPFWRNVVGVASVTAVLANWFLFLWLAYRGQIGGFGTHYMTTRSADLYLLAALGAFAASFALRSKSRTLAVIASFLMLALWSGSELVA